MPNPNRQQVHVNRPLTMMSLAYIQDQSAFIAGTVFPEIPVQKQSDLYFIYNRADFNRSQMKRRAPGTESAGGGYTFSQDSYFCHVHAFHKDTDDQTRANYDEPLNADRDDMQFVTRKGLLHRESEWAANFFVSGKWGKDIDGVASSPTAGSSLIHWSDYTNSDPITDVELYRQTMLETTGYEPNTLVLGSGVWAALKNHPDLIDRIKYGSSNGSPAIVTLAAVAALFEVERIVVAKAIVTDESSQYSQEPAAFPNSANPDVQKFVMNKKAGLLCYVPPAPGIRTPGAGYTFTWTGYAGANAWGGVISRFRMENLKSDRIEIESTFSQKIVGKDLGYFFTDLIA